MGALKPVLRPQVLRQAFLTQPLAAARPTIAAAFVPARRASSTSQPAVPQIPAPTAFCPDVATFLKLIGRGLGAHASKFPSWESLFSLESDQLRELGIEPPRSRRYLIQWRQRFRRGEFGVGGEFRHVQDGVAELRVLEHDATNPANPKKYVVNVPLGQSVAETKPEDLSRVQGYRVNGAKTIVGPHALPLKSGEGVRVAVTEGMWEDKRGRKIDGGERRRTEIRYKKGVQERREARERGELR
ncbi:hypothetical protein JX266_001473 [Neoarthrinium moseri]|nr:hypothetical protein JX266_001473 [Neoarthrinium moseri]